MVLAMAVMLSGLWGYSHLYHVSACRIGPSAIHEIAFEDGCLIWIRDQRDLDLPHRLTGSLWEWNSIDALQMTGLHPKRVRDPLVFREIIKWQWRWGDFNFGEGSESVERRQYAHDSTRVRNDPEEIRHFATTTHLLRDYFDRRTVWVIPIWFIVLVSTSFAGGLILIPRSSPGAERANRTITGTNH